MIYVVCVFFLHLIIFYIMIYTKSHDVQKLRLNQMNGVLVLLNHHDMIQMGPLVLMKKTLLL
ncbi:hypothetical protein RhiirB3_57407 [Rhizophagus irregularis]|nr:hypothetical protein RhiirB3_57407 [Rhizophagus irregularis]